MNANKYPRKRYEVLQTGYESRPPVYNCELLANFTRLIRDSRQMVRDRDQHARPNYGSHVPGMWRLCEATDILIYTEVLITNLTVLKT